MFATLSKKYTFNAAHCLPKLPPGHKCHRLHGHDYVVELVFRGEVGEDGFVIDYDKIDEAWAPLYEAMDHRYLNDIPGLETPSIEVMAHWMWKRLGGLWPMLQLITLTESITARCEVTRADYESAE